MAYTKTLAVLCLAMAIYYVLYGGKQKYSKGMVELKNMIVALKILRKHRFKLMPFERKNVLASWKKTAFMSRASSELSTCIIIIIIFVSRICLSY